MKAKRKHKKHTQEKKKIRNKKKKTRTIIYKQEITSKTKTCPNVKQHEKTKILESVIEFVLVIYCWARDLHSSVVYMPSDTLLGKTNTSFASRCSLERASALEMGVHVHFPLLALGPYLP